MLHVPKQLRRVRPSTAARRPCSRGSTSPGEAASWSTGPSTPSTMSGETFSRYFPVKPVEGVLEVLDVLARRAARLPRPGSRPRLRPRRLRPLRFGSRLGVVCLTSPGVEHAKGLLGLHVAPHQRIRDLRDRPIEPVDPLPELLVGELVEPQRGGGPAPPSAVAPLRPVASDADRGGHGRGCAPAVCGLAACSFVAAVGSAIVGCSRASSRCSMATKASSVCSIRRRIAVISAMLGSRPTPAFSAWRRRVVPYATRRCHARSVSASRRRTSSTSSRRVAAGFRGSPFVVRGRSVEPLAVRRLGASARPAGVPARAGSRATSACCVAGP